MIKLPETEAYSRLFLSGIVAKIGIDKHDPAIWTFAVGLATVTMAELLVRRHPDCRANQIFIAARKTAYTGVGSKGDLVRELVYAQAKITPPSKTFMGKIQQEFDDLMITCGNLAAVPDTLVKDGPLAGTEYIYRLSKFSFS